MNRIAPPPSPPPDTEAGRDRIHSLDVFRGAVVFLMIFVNHLAPLESIPGWLKHHPPDQEGMTFVDVILPAFLFAAGASIPAAFDRRRRRGDPYPKRVGHAALRTGGLLLLGLLMSNLASRSPGRPDPGRDALMVALVLGAVLWWLDAAAAPSYRMPARAAGGGMLILVAVLFERNDGGWLRATWGAIPGLIGCAYTVGVTAYLTVGRNPAGLLAGLGLLILLAAAGTGSPSPWPPPWDAVPRVVGSHGAILLAGVLAGTRMTGAPDSGTSGGIPRDLALLGAGLCVAGCLLRPVHGIYKIRATDSWALLSAGFSAFGLAAVRMWPADPRPPAIAAWLGRTGENAFLAYLLSEGVMPALRLAGEGAAGSFAANGFSAVLRGLMVAGIITWFSARLTRRGVRLHL